MSNTTSTTNAAEQSRLHLAEAKAERRRIRDEHEQSRAVVDDLQLRLKRGDSSVDLTALATQRARVADLGTLLAALDRKVIEAQRALVTDDPSLAEAIAPLVQDILQVPVTVQTERPTSVPSAKPHAFLVQRQPTKLDTTKGTLSGRVVLHFVRTAHHRQVDADGLGMALDDAGVRLASVLARGDYEMKTAVVDRIELAVNSAWAVGLPVIAGPVQTFRVNTWASAAANGVARSMQSAHGAGRRGVRTDSSGDASITLSNVVTSGSASVITEREEAGRRELSVKLTISARNARGALIEYTPTHFAGRLCNAIEEEVGTNAAGLGRVQSVQITGTEPLIDRGQTIGARVRSQLIIACEVPS